MSSLFSGLGLKVQGHLKIYEYASRSDYLDQRPAQKLLDRRNAVHKDNASILVIKAITNRQSSNIRYMVFGNGGTTIDDTGTISFKPTNDADVNADLYNPVFFQMVDDRVGALPGNQMAVRHIGNTLFSDVDIRALVNINEPFGQRPSNTIKDITEANEFGPLYTQFTFDEIGLKLGDGTLLTHVIFTPILKTASTLLEVVYTLRVAIDLPIIDRTNDLFGFDGVQTTAQSNPITVSVEEASTEICLPGIRVSDNEDNSFPQFEWEISVPSSNYGMAIVWGRYMVAFGTYDYLGGGMYFDRNSLRLVDVDSNLIMETYLNTDTDTDSALCNDIVSWDTATQTVQWMRDGVMLDLTGLTTWYSTNEVAFPPGDVFGLDPYPASSYSPGYAVFYYGWYDHLDDFYDLTEPSLVNRIRSNTGQIIDPGANGENITGDVPAVFVAGTSATFANFGYGGTMTNIDTNPLFDDPNDSCAVLPHPPKGIAFTQQPGPTVYDEPI